MHAGRLNRMNALARSMPRRAALACATAVIAMALSGNEAVARGPNMASFDAELAGGASLPPAGTPVSSKAVFSTSSFTADPPPSSVELPDYLELRFGAIELQGGPGLPGGMPAAGIGAQAGNVNALVHTPKIIALANYNNWLGTSSSYNGMFPECGDNRWSVRTRDYSFPNFLGPEDDQIHANYTSRSFVGDMGRETDTVNGAGAIKNRPDSLFAGGTPAWNAAQYADEATLEPAAQLFIQSYDDDNNNGIPDWQAEDTGSAASKAEPVISATGLADPFTSGSLSSAYRAGQVQTQHDYDRDGIPNGVEYMPDFLPAFVDSLGLTDSWIYRGYGILQFWILTPLDVNVLGFRTGVAGEPSRFIVILGNPYAPANPATAMYDIYCTPFTLTFSMLATTAPPDFGRGIVPSVQAGETVQVVAAAGTQTVEARVSDGDDFDMDGLAGPEDLCDLEGPANDDPDNDLVSSTCDVDGDGAKTSVDWDGDGWQNNIDNCPGFANPLQLDRDVDSAGDVPACDPLLVSVDGEWNGKGDGTAISSLLDNDLVCIDAYTTEEPMGDAVTSCSDVDDANDDGEPDSIDCDSNEDGDLLADCADAEPLNPLNASDGDFDNDGCTDAQELGPDAGSGGAKMPFNWWDHYDVTLDGSVDLSDTLDVLAYFGWGPDDPGAQERDRALPWPDRPSIMMEGDDGVDLSDALNTLAQFGIGCASPPGAAPPPGAYIGG